MAIIQVESGKLFTEQDIDGLTTRLQLKKIIRSCAKDPAL